uniref:alcohol dehydrogenase catalytic domain-containing protein n=1 Tax=Piscinibacter sp. TaxID=1903157 RepID=UPI0037852F16
MHAWLCENPTGVDAVAWKELPTPQPAAGEVLIAIKAASLNFPDLLVVQGKYQVKPTPPFVPGSEFAGVVEAVGDGVRHVKAGDPVAAFAGTGGFATHACVKAEVVMPLPRGFAFDDAAAFVLTYGTSHHALVDRAALKAGETLLVLGAAGGVGTAAVQIGKAVGARVIAAVSSEAKAQVARARGADATVVYPREPSDPKALAALFKEACGREGAQVIYDPVGGDLAAAQARGAAELGVGARAQAELRADTDLDVAVVVDRVVAGCVA